MMRKIIAFWCLIVMSIFMVTACAPSKPAAATKAAGQKLKVVCTIFPAYDFVRQVAGDKVDLTMLLKPGAESHSFEPSPKDMAAIQASDLFIYVGGDSDAWVEKILQGLDQKKVHTLKMMDCVQTVPEELVAGMQPEKDDAAAKTAGGKETDPEMDEHVWTSPVNAIKIVARITKELDGLDSAHKEEYDRRAQNYIQKLQGLDQQFKEVVARGHRKEILVGDRFPFRYFCKEYGLKYYAAYPGCSTDTEVNAGTIAFLVDKAKHDKLPVVFHIELSNEKMAQAIAESTGAKNLLLNAVHNVSAADFKAGATYESLMQHNVAVLKEALN